MDSALWIALLLCLSLAFNVRAHWASARQDREKMRVLLEIHGMLITLTKSDDKVREVLFNKVMEQEPR